MNDFGLELKIWLWYWDAFSSLMLSHIHVNYTDSFFCYTFITIWSIFQKKTKVYLLTMTQLHQILSLSFVQENDQTAKSCFQVGRFSTTTGSLALKVLLKQLKNIEKQLALWVMDMNYYNIFFVNWIDLEVLEVLVNIYCLKRWTDNRTNEQIVAWANKNNFWID